MSDRGSMRWGRVAALVCLGALGGALAGAAGAAGSDWRLAPGRLEVRGDAAAMGLELGAVSGRSGELRLAQPVEGGRECRFRVGWSFDRGVGRLRAGERFGVAIEVESLSRGGACSVDGQNAPRFRWSTGEPDLQGAPALFSVIDRGRRSATFEVGSGPAEEGSLRLQVATRDAAADVEWRYVPVRRFAVPEAERVRLETARFRPGPGGSRIFELPGGGGGQPGTLTLETRFQHAAKFACTFSAPLASLAAVEGTYRTVVNVRNPGEEEVRFAAHVSLSRQAEAGAGGAFRVSPPRLLELGGGESLELDCGTVAAAFCPIDGVCVHLSWAEGFIVVDTPEPLDVTAVLSAGPTGGEARSADVEAVAARRLERSLQVEVPPTAIPVPDPVFEQPVGRTGPVFPAADTLMGNPCPSECVEDVKIIIGCDNRTQGPTDAEEAATAPWRHVGRLSNGCSGTLIGPQHVLTAAHCLLNCSEQFVSGPIHFRLGQFSAGPCGQRFGTYYARRFFVPGAYDNCTGSEEDRALDYAVVELGVPIPDATALEFGHVAWSTLQNLTPFSIGYPSDKTLGTVWQTGSDNSFLESPFRWLDGGDKGLLYATNDGVDGQSGSPVYVFVGGERRVVGVLIGAPQAACEQGQDWVARITPEAAERIANATMFWPHGNVIDFSWQVHELPGNEILPDVPAADGCGF